MSDLESVASSQGVPLPSLKASGLLDSWRPPSEAFASSLSLGSQSQPPHAAAAARMIQNQGIITPSLPPSHTWVVDAAGGGRI